MTTEIGHDEAALDAIFDGHPRRRLPDHRAQGRDLLRGRGRLVRIVQAILRDQHTVLSVSSLISDYYGIDDVYLSVPAVIGRAGVERILPLSLSADEASGLRRSAGLLRGHDRRARGGRGGRLGRRCTRPAGAHRAGRPGPMTSGGL